ncbi:hypothetical protein ACEPAF_3983 [Sanghuangporus sanghuang]|uniref:Uncharacterized protein n=1 Tax=Sanghuangporus baumii TaxID=108892 RepID=A0A9Q5HUF7_SANBA|nr:hypothetical protein A7U60_g6806 [Sanghuangporus baumii]
MTPVTYSWNARTASLQRPGKIKERSQSSQVPLSSAVGFDTSSRADSTPFSTLPSYGRAGSTSGNSKHAHTARNSIWSWASGVDPGQHPLLHRSAPLRSNSLQVPCDVDMDRDLYSPRTVPSSLRSHLSAAAEMSAPGSSCSNPLSDRRTRGFDSISFTSDRMNEDGLNCWQQVMDEAPSFLAFSPCPSSCSSTMGFTSTLPREPALMNEATYRTLLDKWTESEEWKEEAAREREGSTSGFEVHYNVDAYPRSAASSPHFSDVEMHPAVLPALLDQQDFSTLMLQSFRLALAEAKLQEGGGFEGFSAAAEAAPEDGRASVASFPSHLQDFECMDQWSPPALRSSSSASSLDPFHLDLFSPQSEQTDPAAIWEAHRTPGDSSDSREYFSSSPFVGWSSSSDADTKPALLTLNAIRPISSVAPLAEVPLYQPQPIRPVRPIDISANLENEFPERSC